MPHSKERPTGRFSGESMGNALALVKQGISIREAAKLTNLAYATVRRYWLKKQQQQNDGAGQQNFTIKRRASSIKYDWNKMFTAEQEQQLAQMCRGATLLQCQKLIYQMAIENNVRMNPKWHIEQLAGRDWLENFQKRQRAILISNDNDCSHLNTIINDNEIEINQSYHNSPVKTEIIEINNHHMPSPHHNWNGNFNSETEGNNDKILGNNIEEKSHSPSLNPLTLLANENNDDESAECTSGRSKTAADGDITKNFQNGLLNVLNHIAGLAAKEREMDPDEMFLMSLLPALKKVKEEDKLKARIELIKVLDHF